MEGILSSLGLLEEVCMLKTMNHLLSSLCQDLLRGSLPHCPVLPRGYNYHPTSQLRIPKGHGKPIKYQSLGS